MSNYDSKVDTLEHIRLVDNHLKIFVSELLYRGSIHDNSKLESPEKELFDKYTPLLKELEYGSDDYKKSLELLKPALDHHYKHNSHHPEHYVNGINGFDLVDLIEMYCDWAAAVKRHKGGDMLKSIDINKDRFNMSEQLVSIFRNTLNNYPFI